MKITTALGHMNGQTSYENKFTEKHFTIAAKKISVARFCCRNIDSICIEISEAVVPQTSCNPALTSVVPSVMV